MDELSPDQDIVVPPVTEASDALSEIRKLREIQGSGVSDVMKLYQKYMQPAPKPQIFGFSYDPALMNISRALLKPTVSGSTGESIGFAAEAAETSRLEQEKRDRELLKSKIELAQLAPALAEKSATSKTEDLVEKLASGIYKMDPSTGKYQVDRAAAAKLSQYPELQAKVLTKIRNMKDALTPKFEKLGAGDILLDLEDPNRPVATAPFKPLSPGEGYSVNVNEKTGEIVVVNKLDNSFKVVRPADIPLDVRLENQKTAIEKASNYPPEQRQAKVAEIAEQLNNAYLKANAKMIAGSSGTWTPSEAPKPGAAPSAAPGAVAPTAPTTGPTPTAARAAAAEPTMAEAAPTLMASKTPSEKKYVSPFGDYVVAPPSPIATAGEETPQQKGQRESQLRISEEDAKEWNKKVNSTSSSGAADASAARQLLAAIPKIGKTGSLTPIKREIGAVMSSLGLTGNITDAASAIDIAQSAVNSRTLGQQLEQVGVQTKSDTELIMRAGPSLSQPNDALTFLARQSLAAGERKMEMARFREDWRRNNRGDIGAADSWYRYIAETPLVGQTPNGKLMFVNEYVKAFSNAHREMDPSEARAAALDNWRRMVRGQ
jgi:hypothetical protein